MCFAVALNLYFFLSGYVIFQIDGAPREQGRHRRLLLRRVGKVAKDCIRLFMVRRSLPTSL
jgi:hypothetical protein